MTIRQRMHIIFSLLVILLTACGNGDENSPDNAKGAGNGTNGDFSIANTSPFDGEGNISVTEKITINFNTAPNAATLTMKSIVLHSMNSHKQIQAQISYDEATRIATINPAILEYDNHYMLDITNSVLSKTGEKLEKPQKIEFFTETKPPLFLQEPANAENNVNTRTIVKASFDNPIDSNTVNQNSFYLEDDATDNKISGLVSFNANTAIFKPTAELSLNKKYRAVLSTAIKADNGQAVNVNDIVWSFTTSATRSATLHIASPENDSANFISLDSQGNMLVVGSTRGQLATTVNLGNDDAYVAKYNNDHVQQWLTQFGTNEFDAATHISWDSDTNVYVLGYTDGSIDGVTSPTKSDIFASKLDANGLIQWTIQFSSVDGHDMPHGILIVNDKLYITGSTTGEFSGQTSAGKHDYFIAEHDRQTGVQNWLIQSGNAGDDHVIGMVADDTGNLILGVTTETFNPDVDFEGKSSLFLYAYTIADTSATLSWQSALESDDLLYMGRSLIEVNNSIYVVGEKWPYFTPNQPPPPSVFDELGVFIAKFDANSSGSVVWEKRVNDIDPQAAETIAIDRSENIYLAGFVFDFPPPFFGGNPPLAEEMQKITVQKFNNNIESQWSAKISATNHASVKSMVLDEQGILHLLGETHGNVDGNSNLGEQDAFIAKIDSNTGEIQ